MSDSPTRGRPTAYTPDLANEICERMASGESLNAICAGDGMPSEGTVRGWALDDREGFSAKYARARELQGHAAAERAVAEGMRAGVELDPAAARVRFDALRWQASKLAPKVFGEKSTLEHTGKDGGPVATSLEVRFVKSSDPRSGET